MDVSGCFGGDYRSSLLCPCPDCQRDRIAFLRVSNFDQRDMSCHRPKPYSAVEESLQCAEKTNRGDLGGDRHIHESKLNHRVEILYSIGHGTNRQNRNGNDERRPERAGATNLRSTRTSRRDEFAFVARGEIAVSDGMSVKYAAGTRERDRKFVAPCRARRLPKNSVNRAYHKEGCG